MVDVRAGLLVKLAVIQEIRGKTRPYEDGESTIYLEVDFLLISILWLCQFN